MCSAICAAVLAVCAGLIEMVIVLLIMGAVAVDKDYSNSEIANAIDEWIHSERDRAILKRRLIDGVVFESLAEEFDLSVRQIKTIVYKAQERVFSRLG